MKTDSVFSPGVLKTIILWAAMLALSLVLFSGFIVPVQAAGSGWVEARVTVPSGFKENVIVTVVNSENGAEYATRLMEENDYVSIFSLPAGSYYFDGAFLENSDFRYNINLTNGAETFDVSGKDKAPAVLLSFDTTYNSAYSDGAKPTDPPETIETLPEETGSVVTIGVESGNNNNTSTTKPSATGNKPGEQQPAETGTTDAATTPTNSVQESISSGSETVPESENQYTFEPGTSADVDSPQNTVNDPAQTEDPSVESEQEESLSLGKRLLFGLIATVVFGLVVFGLAYLYRRHLENS